MSIMGTYFIEIRQDSRSCGFREGLDASEKIIFLLGNMKWNGPLSVLLIIIKRSQIHIDEF